MLEVLAQNAILMPICVFLLRIVDVSLGTLKLLFMVRGYRLIASALAFVEISVWLCATTIVFNYLNNFWNIFAFALGFSTGTAVGMTIERWIGVGHVLVRIFTKSPNDDLRLALKNNQFGATSFQGVGHFGEHSVLLVLTTSKNAERLTRLVRENDPEAVMTVDAVRSVFGTFGMGTPMAGALRK